MNGQPHVDHGVVSWLRAIAPERAPVGIVEGAVESTAHMNPLPAWRAMLSVEPMRSDPRLLVGSPVVRAARTVAVLVALTMLLTIGGLTGAGMSQRPSLDPRSLDAVPFELTFRLHPEAMEGVSWTLVESGKRGRRFQADDDRPYGFLGNLIVEQPAVVYEDWGRRKVQVPQDLLSWLRSHPSLNVGNVAQTALGGRPAISVDVSPVYPVPSPRTGMQARYPHLTPLLFFDGIWRYRMVLVDTGQASWFIVTCEAPRDRWGETADACDDLLATWEWPEP